MKYPQPIGIFSFPASYLVLPESFGNPSDAALLMRGQMPSGDSFYSAALAGDTARALEMIADDDSPEARYNRFVLSSSQDEYEVLKSQLTGDLKLLLDITAFTLNYTPLPPSAETAAGEIRALALSARATYEFECGEIENATEMLKLAREAANDVSPVYAAQIAGNLAEIKHQTAGASAEVVNLYNQATDGLKNTELHGAKAVLHLNAGICYQEMARGSRGALLEAVVQYQHALKYFTRESAPEEYAFTHNNLALAYLSIPLTEASDTLRVAIAIQSLREALKVYTRETHPELWASTQLNLANALQHAPSGHIEENLLEAANLYDEILEVRSATEDPAGYARLLANQGNALAHLGLFDHALPKLTEARDIFNQIGEPDSAEAIDEVIRMIGEMRDQTKAAGTGE